MRTVRLILTVTVVMALAVPPAVAATGTTGAPDSPPVEPALAHCEDLFDDVPCGHRFYGEIGWMVDRAITGGYGDGRFGAADLASRQAFAAFLYRLEGSPAGPFPDPGYTDVPATHPFFTEIAWLADSGIGTGFGDGTFRPHLPLPRQAVAAFLYRLEGSPAGPFPDPGYTDVPATHVFFTEIAWLTETGVATGKANGEFGATLSTVRQTIAAFLYRLNLYRALDVDTADRCEFLDPAHCLLTFPSDHFTVADPSTDTGRRLDFQTESIPPPVGGPPSDTTELNRNDGFSPGTSALTQVPGIDLDQTDVAPLGDLGESLEHDSPTVIVDATTGQHHPHWAELDNSATAENQALMLRPGVNFEEGHRYVVALRNLEDESGEVIAPTDVFRSYRDAITTPIPTLEARRPAMEDLFATLEAAGVPRDDLYLAWDFTVASERNLSERMLHIRDTAFDELASAAPTVDITGVVDQSMAQDDDIARVITGKIEVPLFLTGAGEPGSSFNWGPSGLPEKNGTFMADFTCQIPHSASAGDPARLSLYGHGLLGSRGEVGAGNVEDFSNEHNIVFCATDWIGMSGGDILNVVGILGDLSKFNTLADRVQQGILNTLFLGRAMKHDDGLVTDPAFQDGGGDPLIATGELFFDGNSQGAIIGGAATAVAQDWTRAVLGVPGMNYSLLLQRSSDWPTYESIMQVAYPNTLDQLIGLNLIQALWDRAETNGYAHHLTTDPYPNTPEHQILLHVAYGDFQVSMWSAEIEARTIGALIRQPALAPGRHPDPSPFFALTAVPGDGFTGSALVYWDSGTPPPPSTNDHPMVGSDPHGRPRAQASARTQKSTFFDGTYVDVCGGAPCLAP
jgi:hypothetical protein